MKTAGLLCFLIGLCLPATARKGKPANPVRPVGTYILVQVAREDGTLTNSSVGGEIRFDQKGNNVHVYFGCNRITASFATLRDQRCKPDILMSTRIACEDSIEDLFKNAFLACDHYRLRRDTLTLYREQSTRMILVKQSAVSRQAAVKDAQGSYQLYQVRDGKTLLKGNYSKSRIRIDGKLFRANVGCNGITGEWITEGQAIRPMRLGMTEMYCEEVDRLERLFVSNLEKSNRWRWKNGRLEFLRDEEVLLVFARSKN